MSSTHVEGLQIVSVASEDPVGLLFVAGELDFATAGPVRTRLREFGDRPGRAGPQRPHLHGLHRPRPPDRGAGARRASNPGGHRIDARAARANWGARPVRAADEPRLSRPLAAAGERIGVSDRNGEIDDELPRLHTDGRLGRDPRRRGGEVP